MTAFVPWFLDLSESALQQADSYLVYSSSRAGAML